MTGANDFYLLFSDGIRTIGQPKKKSEFEDENNLSDDEQENTDNEMSSEIGEITDLAFLNSDRKFQAEIWKEIQPKAPVYTFSLDSEAKKDVRFLKILGK